VISGLSGLGDWQLEFLYSYKAVLLLLCFFLSASTAKISKSSALIKPSAIISFFNFEIFKESIKNHGAWSMEHILIQGS